MGKIIITTGQFAQCLDLNETPAVDKFWELEHRILFQILKPENEEP